MSGGARHPAETDRLDMFARGIWHVRTADGLLYQWYLDGLTVATLRPDQEVPGQAFNVTLSRYVENVSRWPLVGDCTVFDYDTPGATAGSTSLITAPVVSIVQVEP